MAVMLQENTYNRYKEGIVLKYAKMVYTQITRDTQEPLNTIIVGTSLFPSALDAAIVQSMKADTA